MGLASKVSARLFEAYSSMVTTLREEAITENEKDFDINLKKLLWLCQGYCPADEQEFLTCHHLLATGRQTHDPHRNRVREEVWGLFYMKVTSRDGYIICRAWYRMKICGPGNREVDVSFPWACSPAHSR